ncbi:MAG: glycosyltransferase family 2 protein [Patescibacteria group bacterium]
MITLSIIVATHNRPQLLKKCLASLHQQLTKDTELIVVDNYPQKTAKNIVSNFKNTIYLFEKNTGLSFARNTGWKKANGKYVAYIDDDSIADSNFVGSILNFIKKEPKIEAFGGSYSRHSNKKIPFWFPESYGTMNNGKTVKKLIIGSEWLSGTSMIFKKSLLKDINGFNNKLGMIGNKVSYGEETDLLIRLSLAGIPIYYDPKIKVSHFLADKKINLIWLIQDAFRRGQSTFFIQNKYPKLFANKSPIKKPTTKQNLAQKIISLILLVSFAMGKTYAKIN